MLAHFLLVSDVFISCEKLKQTILFIM